MQVGSLLIWLVLFGVIIYAYYRFKSNSKVKVISSMLPIVLLKLLIKLFLVSFILTWVVLFLLNEIYHAIVIVGLFYLISILTLSSITIFFNLIQRVRFTGFLSGASFFLTPILISVIGSQNLAQQDPEFKFFVISTLVFFVVLTYYFIRFRSAVAEE